MKNRYFDTHCHFDFDAFNADRDEQWMDCLDQGIKRLLIPGVYPDQWELAKTMSIKYKGLCYAVGLHPWWVSEHFLPDEKQWADYLKDGCCVAIGECGLDKVINTPLEYQQEAFERHLMMASKYDLPVVVHVRQTHNETIRLLKRYQLNAGGVIHGFTGSYELARTYWELGFYLGVGGSITYPRAQKTHDAIRRMPLESLVLETDAPDMPLYGFQGQKNFPQQIIVIANNLSELTQLPIDIIINQAWKNSCQLFGLDNDF